MPVGTARAFLAPLPVSRLWGVGPKTDEVLRRAGLLTIGDVASHDVGWLTARLGSLGHHLFELSQAIDTRVVVPDRDAGCSLVDACPVDQLRAWKQRNPGHVVVSYINTSIEVKAESDIICTSRNAVAVVNSIPAERPILFLPDLNLGNYVKQQTGRENMKIWQGACIVHATFPARRVVRARSEHPNALVASHPECPAEVLRMSDFIGSTSAIIDWCVKQPASEFIVMTESGVRHSLEKLAPEKKFYFVANENCNCSECPYMKRNTLEKLRDALLHLEPRVELSPEILEKARRPVERMLALR